MGNTIGVEDGGGRKNFVNSGSGAAPKFRVYIHRRNRVIHAWLRILPDQIQLEPETKAKQKPEIISWPLELIRRYGYTSAGVFFFESGRRCPTGEGLHCFQTQYADTVFHLVQQRVQENTNSKQTPRQSSTRSERARSSQPDVHIETDRGKINPLQRFGSEGTCVSSDFKPSKNGNSWSPVSLNSKKFRNNGLTNPRPRSATYIDDNMSALPTYKLQKDQSDLGKKIVGNIISECTNPSVPRDEFDLMALPRHNFPEPHIPPTYVNVTPTINGSGVALKFHRARTNSSSSMNSQPTSPVNSQPTVFPIRWDTTGPSTSMLCHLPICEQSGTIQSYVNLNTPKEASIIRPFMGANYVDVSMDAPYTIKMNTPTKFNNYARIDTERTKALQHAALEKQIDGKRRHIGYD